MSKHEYQVTIPIAGHAFLTVEADSEEEAIELAMGEVTIDDFEGWEPVETFIQGNVCYCPQPWSVDVRDMGEVEDAEDAP